LIFSHGALTTKRMITPLLSKTYDVIVIGGSFSGASSALLLIDFRGRWLLHDASAEDIASFIVSSVPKKWSSTVVYFTRKS
jgi:hypothetical protein